MFKISLVKKAEAAISKVIITSIAAGFILGIAAFASLFAPNKIISGIVFSTGLFLICELGLNLFTGNMLLTIVKMNWKQYIKMWGLVYLFNFVGALLICYLIQFSGLSNDKLQILAEYKLNIPFVQCILRGIGCNILVCLAVFLGFNQNSCFNKFVAISIPVSLFIICGFEHSIANMFFLGNYSNMLNNIIPVTIGNIIGGILISKYIGIYHGDN